MSKINNGGPAFPITLNSDETFVEMGKFDGMTLRDWFAGMALQGLISATNQDGDWTAADSSHTTAVAFLFADYMISEREKAEADK
jgi:hypothetical protein